MSLCRNWLGALDTKIAPRLPRCGRQERFGPKRWSRPESGHRFLASLLPTLLPNKPFGPQTLGNRCAMGAPVGDHLVDIFGCRIEVAELHECSRSLQPNAAVLAQGEHLGFPCLAVSGLERSWISSATRRRAEYRAEKSTTSARGWRVQKPGVGSRRLRLELDVIFAPHRGWSGGQLGVGGGGRDSRGRDRVAIKNRR